MCFVYMIASIRTNVVFFLIFLFLVITLSLLAGSFWQLGQGNTAFGVKLQIVSLNSNSSAAKFVSDLFPRRAVQQHLLLVCSDGTSSQHRFFCP